MKCHVLYIAWNYVYAGDLWQPNNTTSDQPIEHTTSWWAHNTHPQSVAWLDHTMARCTPWCDGPIIATCFFNLNFYFKLCYNHLNKTKRLNDYRTWETVKGFRINYEKSFNDNFFGWLVYNMSTCSTVNLKTNDLKDVLYSLPHNKSVFAACKVVFFNYVFLTFQTPALT